MRNMEQVGPDGIRLYDLTTYLLPYLHYTYFLVIEGFL